jgi:hypothetical protein
MISWHKGSRLRNDVVVQPMLGAAFGRALTPDRFSEGLLGAGFSAADANLSRTQVKRLGIFHRTRLARILFVAIFVRYDPSRYGHQEVLVIDSLFERMIAARAEF